jgi:hypothetical protein
MIAPAQPHVFTNVDWNRMPAPSQECACGMPLLPREDFCPDCAKLIERARSGDFAAVVRARRILEEV